MEPVFSDTVQQISTMTIEKSERYKGLLHSRQPRVLASPGTVVSVRNEDCIDACVRIIQERPGIRLGLLNMASERSPGGGVTRGAHAQEEDICRRTTLYPTLTQQRYPIAHDELMYSPNVKVVKGSDYSRLQSPLVNIAGVVSAAAVRFPALDGIGQYREADLVLMKNKVRMVLETFEFHKITHLVLGAWGCGAFRNPPKQVAEIFRDTLKEFGFVHVTFAITTPYANDRRNLAIFSDAFSI